MPNYNPALTTSLWVGSQKVLADSTLITPFTTVAVAIGREPGSDAFITVSNPSSSVATVQSALVDADGNYLPFGTAPAGQVTQIPCTSPFARLSFAGAPNATVTVSR